MRRKFASSKADLLNPATRCIKMGINNVTLLHDSTSGCYRYLLGFRSSKILEYPYAYHVVPAGTFEPSKKTYFFDQLEGEPFGNVLRELYEECFLGEKKEAYDKNPSPLSEVIKERELAFIYNNRNDKNKVEFKIAGVYFDYFSPKVEMTTCLVVHDPDYYRDLESDNKLISNWEYGGDILKEPFTKSGVERWINSKNMLTIGSIALDDAVNVFPALLHKD